MQTKLTVQYDYPNIEGTIDSDDENTIHAILLSNSFMQPEIIHTPATPPMSSDDAPAGNLTFTLPFADRFLEIQGWTKSGTAINLSNLVEHSQDDLSHPKCLLYAVNPSFPGDQITQITDSLTSTIQGITGNENICLFPPVLTHGLAKSECKIQLGVESFLFCLSNIMTGQRDWLVSQQCWSTDIITFFVIPFTPKLLTYLTTIHKLTHPNTEAGTRRVSGVIKMAIQNSPEATALITANCDAISSSLSPEQAVTMIVNSVMVRKMDLIVAGGHKERTWAIYATSPTEMFNTYLTWRNLIGTLSFDADLATHGEGIHCPKELHCTLCYGINHPTPLCPYPLTTRWCGPVPHAAGHKNAAPTIDFDALQVLDIHRTPAHETRSD
ncbi:hypothetical protein ARMGADRAFT_1090166 [Armillaria gallica]|uniref:Uncharacterized protein n=1 Tax=Armillaria gallica TaxID=47427 RepID=A0A2H3CTU2_ARMGA|nr:hypothetical protein ARMGADRAFT_1090166 [Armillaria gallica]